MPAPEPGEVVIMDNLGSCKSSAVRGAIRYFGARLGHTAIRWLMIDDLHRPL